MFFLCYFCRDFFALSLHYIGICCTFCTRFFAFLLVFEWFWHNKTKKFHQKMPVNTGIRNFRQKKFCKNSQKVAVYVVVFTPKCFALHSANLYLS